MINILDRANTIFNIQMHFIILSDLSRSFVYSKS